MPIDAPLLVAMPLPDDWVIAGEPLPRGRVLVTSPDGRQLAGTWECDAGTFRYRHRAAETIRIEAGDVVIQREGCEPRTMRPGDMAHFPADSESLWQVPHYVRKTFFLLKAVPPLSPPADVQAQG
jgi:uncharacterized cupin superfamily protein